MLWTTTTTLQYTGVVNGDNTFFEDKQNQINPPKLLPNKPDQDRIRGRSVQLPL